MSDGPPVSMLLVTLTAVEEHIGDLVVRTLLSRDGEFAAQVRARDEVCYEAGRVLIT